MEERRFFLWLPVAAMGGVALNLSADSEPALWAPIALTLVFAGLAFLARSRPLAFGVTLALAALFAGFLAMSLRTARVAAPVLDRIRIVSLTGTVEEVDLRPVGARMVIAVARADGMPADKVPAPRPGDGAENAQRGRGRFRCAEGAPAAPLACFAPGRLRLRPRRVLRRRRRGRLDARRDPGFAAAG